MKVRNSGVESIGSESAVSANEHYSLGSRGHLRRSTSTLTCLAVIESLDPECIGVTRFAIS